MQKSFWWWQCSDRYVISLSPHLHTPFSPSLLSRTVPVDIKHHVYFPSCESTAFLCGLLCFQDKSWQNDVHLPQTVAKGMIEPTCTEITCNVLQSVWSMSVKFGSCMQSRNGDSCLVQQLLYLSYSDWLFIFVLHCFLLPSRLTVL